MFNLIILLILNANLFGQWQEFETPNGRMIDVVKCQYSKEYLAFYSRHDLFFKKINSSTYKKANFESIDSIGLIHKFYCFKDTIYAYFNATSVPPGISGLYKSADEGNSWINVDSIFNKVNNGNGLIIRDFIVDSTGIHLISNEGYLHYKDNNVIKHTKKYFDIVKKDSNNLDGTNIKLNDNKIIIFDSFLAIGGDQYTKKLLVSEDGGDSFEHRVNGLNIDVSSSHCIANDTIVIGKTSIYISTDFGKSWELRKPENEISFGSGAYSMVYHKNYLFLANDRGQVYKCSKIGVDWEKVFDISGLGPINLIEDGNNLYLGTSNGVYYSSDLGEIFEEVVFEIGTNNFELAKGNDELYLLTYNSGIFKKSNLNESWEILNDSINKFPFDKSSISIEDSIILTGYSSNNKISFSTNYGENWNEVSINKNFAVIKDVLINKSKFFAISNINDFFYSVDLGQTWKSWNEENSSQPQIKLNFLKEYDGDLYSCLNNKGLSFSTDNGTTWNKITENETLLDSLSISDFVKYKNTLFASTGSNIYISLNNGETWKLIENLENTSQIRQIINYKTNIFVYSNGGFYYSKDLGENWVNYDLGIEKFNNSEPYIFKNIKVYEDNLLICFYNGIYKLPLSELGITLSTEKTEKRNYLYTFPPYPQPTNNIVKIETYWDSTLPFTEKDIEVYDLTGVKIKTANTLSIQKESNYNGKIIWDASTQQPGIYILKINHGTETRVRKIMVVE